LQSFDIKMSDKSENIIFDPAEISSREISDPAVLSITPLVSVKMITYNHKPYIAQSIEGVLMQETDFPFELVIGEDCSTDGTREIVFAYQKKHPDIIRVITSGKNVGMNKNSRRTSKLCRGKYIAFCEGDDYWHHPEKLQIQVAYLEAHPECGLVHSDGLAHIVEECRTIPFYNALKKKIVLHNKNVVRSMIAFEYVIITCSAIVRKCLLDEIYETCRFEFSQEQLSGDFQLWLEVAYRSKVKFIDKSLVTYNFLPESASNTKDIEKKIRFQKYCLRIHIHYADKYGDDDSIELKKLLMYRCNKSLIRIACQARKPDLAREVLENSREYDTPLGFVGYLFFFGSQNNAISSIVRAFILLAWQCRKVLSRIEWLRALRDRIRC